MACGTSEPVAAEARGTGPISPTPFGAATRGYIRHALENKKARNALRTSISDLSN
jgi:hypothetical protein